MDSVGFNDEINSDSYLLGQACAGSSESLDTLLYRYEQKVYCMLLALTNSPDQTEQLLYNTFSRVISEASNSISPSASMERIVYRLALECEKEFWQKQGEREATEAVFCTRAISVHRQRIEEEKSAEIDFNRLASFLPHEYRRIIVLSEIVGLTVSAIADVVEISEETARERLRRASSMIRRAARRVSSCEKFVKEICAEEQPEPGLDLLF